MGWPNGKDKIETAALERLMRLALGTFERVLPACKREDERRRTTESAADGTRSKGAAVKAAEATRREKTETVSVC